MPKVPQLVPMENAHFHNINLSFCNIAVSKCLQEEKVGSGGFVKSNCFSGEIVHRPDLCCSPQTVPAGGAVHGADVLLRRTCVKLDNVAVENLPKPLNGV